MKSNSTVYLESKEIKEIIAKALGISIENVISTHYSFGIVGVPENVVKERFEKLRNLIN